MFKVPHVTNTIRNLPLICKSNQHIYSSAFPSASSCLCADFSQTAGVPTSIRYTHFALFLLLLLCLHISSFSAQPSTAVVCQLGPLSQYCPFSYPSATSAASAGEPQDELPSQYYYVEDQLYYYSDNGSVTPLSSRPSNVWIYHQHGWSATNRTKYWRMWDGKHDRYN